MSDLPSEHVRTLLAVIDAGTFDAAAAALHVTPSAVSQRVKALEQRTGRVLVTRGKPVTPTASGALLVRYARQVAALERDLRAELGIASDTEPARLSIAVNADSLATWFLPAIARVPQSPPICFDLHREDEAHTATLLRRGQVMAAVTSSADPVAGCTARPLGLARYLPVATPEFTARHLTDPQPADPGHTDPSRAARLVERLPDAPVVTFDRRDALQDDFVLGLTSGERAAGPVRHRVPSSESFRDAVVAGLGWGLVPESHARPLLRTGALVTLGPDLRVDVPLHWQQWKLDVPALTLVAATVAAVAAEALHQPG